VIDAIERIRLHHAGDRRCVVRHELPIQGSKKPILARHESNQTAQLASMRNAFPVQDGNALQEYATPETARFSQICGLSPRSRKFQTPVQMEAQPPPTTTGAHVCEAA
jgi:hypothetical protein